MALESLISSSNEPFNFLIHDKISSNPLLSFNEFAPTSSMGDLLQQNSNKNKCEQEQGMKMIKKRRRGKRVCKNREEAESQRMTHIAVERNRRKQMNHHLSVLRSLMPQSYIQRGDQASIVGGAIEFVKQLEQILQSLEAQKFLTFKQACSTTSNLINEITNTTATAAATATTESLPPQPFSQFFSYPQYTTTTTCQMPNNIHTSNAESSIADIEVTLIETHANIRILSRKRLRQLSKLVGGFHSIYLTILHLNVTTLDPLVLYSISAKVEEGCEMNTADEIAGAVNHMLTIIEIEAAYTTTPFVNL